MSKVYGWEIEVSELDGTIRIIPPPDAFYVSEKYTAILLRGNGFEVIADYIYRAARGVISARNAKRNPYYNKRLTFKVRDDVTAAEIRQWQVKLRKLKNIEHSTELTDLVYCLSDMETRSATGHEDITVLMKWLKKNPDHPFDVNLEEDR